MGYRGYGLPVGELISEGNVGMMQAVKRFDPERGFRLATYAMWWIRAAIQEYILHSWSLVKMGTTAAQKKLFFNLRRLKGQMQAIEDGDLQPEQVAKIATMLDVPEQDVVSMNRRLAAPDHSLNAPVRAGQRGRVAGLAGRRGRKARRPQLGRPRGTQRAQGAAGEALKTLNERERHILIERRLKDNPTTLEDLSQEYNISRERVRQIEVRAFEKLQKAMKAQIAERRLKAPLDAGRNAPVGRGEAAGEDPSPERCALRPPEPRLGGRPLPRGAVGGCVRRAGPDPARNPIPRPTRPARRATASPERG